MGVHGLTTYLRENHGIAKTVQFTSKDTETTSFVVDGWSFIYEALAQADIPWVYGGEYPEFSQTVEKVLRAWLSMGLRLYFVFDGPSPEIKFPTIISRMTENYIKPSLLFFRTSTVSRSKPKFLRESAMLPPRAYTTCVQTLRRLQQSLPDGDRIEMHFADEEGDPYAVELAARLGAYVVGKDSDFVILNAEGYLGYISFDDMTWSSTPTDEISTGDDGWEDDDGFQTVVKSKVKKKAIMMQRLGVQSGQGIIPPEDINKDTLQLSVMAYSPSDLASHLQIPLSLLPLLAALVGNDFTGQRQDVPSATTSQFTNLQWLFFERQLTLTQRITRVATTLKNILNAALVASTKKTKGRDKAQVSSVMELIDRAVTALVVRNMDSLASGEKERIVERIVEATLQYAIPKFEGASGLGWASDICMLHEADVCPLVLLRQPSQLQTSSVDSYSSVSSQSPFDSDVADNVALDIPRSQARSLYISAYRSGYLDPHTLDVLHSGTFWYRQFLENPDLEAVSRTFARPVQLWTYAILDETIGISERELAEDEQEDDEVEKEGEDAQDDDEDELVDVVEDSDTEDDDPLAPLRGALQQLNGSRSTLVPQNGNDSPSSSQQGPDGAAVNKRRKIVEEHIRRGTRLAAEDLELCTLAELLKSVADDGGDAQASILLESQERRLSILLYALGSTSDNVASLVRQVLELSAEHRIPALTLRWVVTRLRSRAQESAGNKEREKEKWSRQEAQAFLSSFSWSSSWVADEAQEAPAVVDRHVQLVAQTLSTMDAIERLSEVLLLSSPSEDGKPAVLPSPSSLFSGRLLHSLLTNSKLLSSLAVPDALWQVTYAGLDDAFGDAGGRKRKKDKKATDSNLQAPSNAKKTPQGKFSGLSGKFGLLSVD